MMKIIRTVTIFSIQVLFSLMIQAQTTSEYLGIIKLNDSSFISYSMHFIEKNGDISGFSITDLGGDHETKSNIVGSYSSKNKTLSFKEVGIIYTKSEVSDYDFCFINFVGRINSIDRQKKISGKFRGIYSDGSSCIDGEIEMKSIAKIEKRAEKIDNVIQKSKKIDQAVKSEISVVKTLDTLRMNILKAGQNLSMFSSQESVKLRIYDAGKIDGDRITVYLNSKIILNNYTVTKELKELTIPLDEERNIVTVHALNSGTIAPNTAKVEIHDNLVKIETITSLASGKKTSFTIIRK